jgi:site-specific recombinase XerD
MDGGNTVDSGFALLSDWLLALRSTGRSEQTIKTYRYAGTQLLNWCSEHEIDDVTELTRQQARAFIAHLLDRYKPKGVESRFRSLRAWWSFMISEEMIDGKNVWTGLSPKVPNELPLTATQDDIDSMLTKANARSNRNRARDHLIIRLLAETGCRRGEIAHLSVGSILVRDGLLHVQVSKSRKRHIALSHNALRAASIYLRRRGVGAGNLWCSESPAELVRAVVRRCGDGKITPHAIRRYWVSAALRATTSTGANGAPMMSEASIISAAGWSKSTGHQMLATYAAAELESITQDSMRAWLNR